MAIEVKEVFIKVYNSVKKVKWYYMPLHYIYEIIFSELKSASKELTLQIAVKAVNNSVNPDRLIPILLVFSAYP